MNVIHIPASIEDAVTSLTGLDALVTASEWKRAAIVYAWTENRGRGGNHGNRDWPMTMAKFGRLGIRGLSATQVGQYREAWASAAAKSDNGDEMLAIEPGDAIDEPALPWKDHFGEPTVEVQERVARSYVRDHPELAVEAVTSDPVSSAKVFVHVADDEDRVADILADAPAQVTDKVQTAVFRTRTGLREATTHVSPPAAHPIDYSSLLMKGAVMVLDALRAERDGKWMPSGFDTLGIHLLTQAINTRAATGTISDDLFDQIAEHMKGEPSNA